MNLIFEGSDNGKEGDSPHVQRNIQLSGGQIYMLCNNVPHSDKWDGLIQGVASIVPMFTNIKLNGCSSQYDIWGLLDRHGRFLNEMFLSSKEQSSFLEEQFSATNGSESTIRLPRYSQKAAKDLEVCYVVSGNKLARTYPEGGQLDMLLERARIFRAK